jgi:hypothetical protein
VSPPWRRCARLLRLSILVHRNPLLQQHCPTSISAGRRQGGLVCLSPPRGRHLPVPARRFHPRPRAQPAPHGGWPRPGPVVDDRLPPAYGRVALDPLLLRLACPASRVDGLTRAGSCQLWHRSRLCDAAPRPRRTWHRRARMGLDRAWHAQERTSYFFFFAATEVV